MRKASFSVSINIQAPLETVFAYVTDLSKHGEWSANPLEVEAISPGSPVVGSRYRSVAQVGARRIQAEFEVTEYEPPVSFRFVGEDLTGKYEHDFKLQAHQGGTRLMRRIRFNLTMPQWLLFYATLFSVRIPAGKKSLALLKKRLEKGQ